MAVGIWGSEKDTKIRPTANEDPRIRQPISFSATASVLSIFHTFDHHQKGFPSAEQGLLKSVMSLPDPVQAGSRGTFGSSLQVVETGSLVTATHVRTRHLGTRRFLPTELGDLVSPDPSLRFRTIWLGLLEYTRDGVSRERWSISCSSGAWLVGEALAGC